MQRISDRLNELGIELSEPVTPVANYVPFVRTGGLVHFSGQLSLDRGESIVGTVGVDVDLERAQQAARLCAINLISQFKAACGGNLERVQRVVKLGGFVQAGPEFEAIPQVMNGCSDLMVAVFGDRGRHARSAVGVYRLPMGFAVEVDAVVQVAPD